jgi:hypothetical protein
VVPSVPILLCSEIIGERDIRGDGTLCDSVNAVHLVGMELANAVPVYRRAVSGNRVGDMDNELIAPASFERRAGVGPVEVVSQDFLNAIGFDLAMYQQRTRRRVGEECC